MGSSSLQGALDAGCATELTLQIGAGRGAEVAGIDDAARAHLSAGAARRAIEHSGRKATADAIRASLECSVQPDGTSAHRNAFRYLIATA